MPAVTEGRSAIAAGVRVAVSAPIELYGLISLVGYAVLLDTIKSPFAERISVLRPDLVERLERLYFSAVEAPELAQSCGCWEASEIFVYAQRSGTLFDADLDRFLDQLDDVARAPAPPGFVMPTEDPTVESMVRERLDENAANPERRAEMVAVFREVWSVIAGDWERHGRDEAERRAIAARRTLAGADAGLEALFQHGHIALKEPYRSIADEAIERRELVVTPVWVGGELKHIVAIPGLVSIGYGEPAGEPVDEARERGTAAAQSFKLFSDPTRATMLRLLIEKQRSIAELAELLDLSQPTVSTHLKQLREAELLITAKHGTATHYKAVPELVQELLAKATGQLALY